MSLYQKHRPQNLDDMYGNQDLKTSLKNYFARPDHNHCHLFYGSSGCGKTTIARAIAKSILNCGDMDITEINASSDNGIDMTRQVEQACHTMPLTDTATVFILDECHNLTTQAKSSLLKTCEDMKDWVYIFFCTTNKAGFLKGGKGETKSALSTRCQQWKLEPLNKKDAMTLLDDVATKENIELSDTVFDKIIEVSHGSSRQILVNLEAVRETEIPESAKIKILENSFEGMSEVPQVRELPDRLLKGDWNGINSIVTAIKNSQLEEPVSLNKMIQAYMSSVLLRGKNDQAFNILTTFVDNNNAIIENGWPAFVACCYAVCR